jgi:cell division protein FtsI/penicillin-binding protein 2
VANKGETQKGGVDGNRVGGKTAAGKEEDSRAAAFANLTPLAKELDFLAQISAQKKSDDELWIVGSQGGKVLTINPVMQKKTTRLLQSFAVPYGAVVAIEPSTGRVLTMAEHSEENPSFRGLALKAVYPAASIFKIVTAAALLQAGVSSEKTVCYHGGRHRLSEKLLKDTGSDTKCSSLAEAMGFSANVVFAKLADRQLSPRSLADWAAKFGFNARFPFVQPVDVSVARIPRNKFEFAKTAAGFGEVFLSPLLAASIAGAIANGGVMKSPVLFEEESGSARRLIDKAQAAALASMMEITVSRGTARRSFRQHGRYVLGDTAAAGKTGSIFARNPFYDYSWFVGWAPVEKPQIAVAVVIVNGRKWRVRAPYIARETLRQFFAETASKTKTVRTAQR